MTRRTNQPPVETTVPTEPTAQPDNTPKVDAPLTALPPIVASYVPNTFSIDGGNGEGEGVCSETSAIVRVEPVIAPITTRRAFQLNEDSTDKPTFTLKTGDEIEVFGIKDVHTYGKKESKRRFNALERYTHPDYFKLIYVLLLQLFRQYLNNDTALNLRGIISVPISVYQDEAVLSEIRNTLATGKELILVDQDGNQLKIIIQPNALTIIPESVGALYYHTFDPSTLKPRQFRTIKGFTMIVDTGYLSTDISIFEGQKYLRDLNESLSPVGMRLVVLAIMAAIVKAAGGNVRGLDETQIDYDMRKWVDSPKGQKKIITIGEQTFDVTQAYDTAIDHLATQIEQTIFNRFSQVGVNRVLLAGGGAYHLRSILVAKLASLGLVAQIDHCEVANAIGGFIILQLQLSR